MISHRRIPRALARPLLALALGAALVSGTAAQTLTLNLKEADIEAVIETIAQMTGRSFIIDPRVKAKVTVISSEPMDADEIYELFLSILTVHGFAAVPTGNVVKIVPEVNAKQDNIPLVPPATPEGGDQYVTRVIKVKNVSAAQLVPVLRPLLPQQGHLAAMPEANVLIAAATAANIDRLVQIIDRVDLATDEAFEVVRLQHAAAAEVVRILETLLAQTAKGQAPAGPGETPTFVADERTNSIIISGNIDRLKLRALIAHLDTPLESEGNTEVIYLRYANAKDLVTVLTGVSETLKAEAAGRQPPQAAAAAAAGKDVTIQADESTNAIVVSAPPDVMRGIKSVIRQLDIRRAQVMVEAIVAEVSTDKQSELGILWGVDGSANNQPVGFVNFGTVASDLAALSLAASGTATAAAAASIPTGLTLAVGDTSGNGGTQFAALLRALAGDADTNILSTPTLVTLDNEEAEIVVGQNVPFVTGSYSNTGVGGTTGTTSVASPFQTIQREDVGITLKVKPQINEGNSVRLEIAQEVSSLAGTAQGTADVVTNKRSIQTVVMVDDGEMLVLGGLVDDNVRESVSKVPGLGDLPVIGNLFRYRQSNKVKRNLMVFLHPVILRDAAQNALVTSSKYSYIRSRQIAAQLRTDTLLPNQETPLIPKWEDLPSLPPPFEAHTGGEVELPEILRDADRP